MGAPARLRAMLAFGAAAVLAGTAVAADRFIPGDPAFVVANVRQAAPDSHLQGLLAQWRTQPGDASSAALGAAFIERARERHEPMFYGRAEAVLAPAARQPSASTATRRLYAETLQYRHDFSAAEQWLDGILRQTPRDPAARALRASVRLVRGEFAGARADCAQLLTTGDAPGVALACLAESLAGTGHIEQARALISRPPPDEVAAVRAYYLTVRAELAERAGEAAQAIADYRAALALAPGEDSIRASLADALIAERRQDQAAKLLATARPGLALLVRAAICAPAPDRQSLARQAQALLALESARGDALHHREAALLALEAGDRDRALRAAVANFAVQRELPDVRVLARAAAATGDDDARRQLVEWLRSTGFRDMVTENILGARLAGSGARG